MAQNVGDSHMVHQSSISRSSAKDKFLNGTAAIADAVRSPRWSRSFCILRDMKWTKHFARGEENRPSKETATATCNLWNGSVSQIMNELKQELEKCQRAASGAFHNHPKMNLEPSNPCNIANVTANSDDFIRKMAAEAMGKMVADSFELTETEKKNVATESRQIAAPHNQQKGVIRFFGGYVSPYFVTNPESLTAVLDNPLILICENKLNKSHQILPLLELIADENRHLLIIAEDVVGEALATLISHNLADIVRCAAVKAPAYGVQRKKILRGIATLTGGTLVTEEHGTKLENLNFEMLGHAKRAEISREDTKLFACGGIKSNTLSPTVDLLP